MHVSVLLQRNAVVTEDRLSTPPGMKTLIISIVFSIATTAAVACPNRNVASRQPAETEAEPAGLKTEVVSAVNPVYPRDFRAKGISGYVRLDVEVNAKGKVVNASVMESNHKDFADEAMRAIGEWRFLPAKAELPDGHRHIQVPIRFVVAGAN